MFVTFMVMPDEETDGGEGLAGYAHQGAANDDGADAGGHASASHGDDDEDGSGGGSDGGRAAPAR